jgi:hypothetical protein
MVETPPISHARHAVPTVEQVGAGTLELYLPVIPCRGGVQGFLESDLQSTGADTVSIHLGVTRIATIASVWLVDV